MSDPIHNLTNLGDARIERLRKRILSHSRKNTRTKCWDWLGYVEADGYSRMIVNGKRLPVHRVSYRVFCGPLDNRHIDHLCRNRRCVNPKHLELVSPRENILRGVSPSAINAAKTHCKRGHAYTPKNTYELKQRKRGRLCRICHRQQTRNSMRRQAGWSEIEIAATPKGVYVKKRAHQIARGRVDIG